MQNLTVIIPTRNRIAKLTKCIESIPDEFNIDIIIVCDGDVQTYNYLINRKFHNMKVIHLAEHKGSVYCRNYAIPMASDGVLYATDDIVFAQNSIQHAIAEFNTRFIDDDGVIGFHQEGSNYHPTGVALVGKAFLDRYPNRQLFYPRYYHFSCQEVYCLANKLDKFYLDTKAILWHIHHGKCTPDSTHVDSRRNKQEDFRIRKERSNNGLIWGEEKSNVADTQSTQSKYPDNDIQTL